MKYDVPSGLYASNISSNVVTWSGTERRESGNTNDVKLPASIIRRGILIHPQVRRLNSHPPPPTAQSVGDVTDVHEIDYSAACSRCCCSSSESAKFAVCVCSIHLYVFVLWQIGSTTIRMRVVCLRARHARVHTSTGTHARNPNKPNLLSLNRK